MNWHDPSLDSRVRRTRKNVVDSFADLAREHAYDEFTVGDVLAGADIGRSTFYAHYRGKDDILLQVFSVFFEMLADCLEAAVSGRDEVGRLVGLLDHIGENRTMMRRLTTGPATEAYQRCIGAFASMLEERIARHLAANSRAPVLPLAYVASSLARAELALVMDWLSDGSRARCTAAEVARGMKSLAIATLDALAPGTQRV